MSIMPPDLLKPLGSRQILERVTVHDKNGEPLEEPKGTVVVIAQIDNHAFEEDTKRVLASQREATQPTSINPNPGPATVVFPLDYGDFDGHTLPASTPTRNAKP